MSERGRASFSNLAGNTGGNLYRVVSSPDSNLRGSMGGNLQRGRTSLPNLGIADPQTNFAAVFSQVTPHGLQMIGGRGEERADNYYTQEDDCGINMQTPRHSNVEDTSGGSNVADSHGSELPLIHRDGKGFADHSIHGYIAEMAWDCLDHAWPRYKSIPREVVKQWFARFKTRYRWNSQEEGDIFDCFESVLKERFRERMGVVKKTSARMARKAGHTIHEINDSYQILQNFAPRPIHEDVWRRLCAYWDTDEWKKKSLIGKRNRSTSVDSGVTATYTGGSIGVSETQKVDG
ncbi:unnamed protein product [Lactuca virosa]|uniref:Uncharacterized protein n=1 Tax=Lactuca virosa TaxID=75947 RepID=A0AAU9MMV7_9ASTR|nr:unnamed protein product [Lactuca virosa]